VVGNIDVCVRFTEKKEGEKTLGWFTKASKGEGMGKPETRANTKKKSTTLVFLRGGNRGEASRKMAVPGTRKDPGTLTKKNFPLGKRHGNLRDRCKGRSLPERNDVLKCKTIWKEGGKERGRGRGGFGQYLGGWLWVV